MALKFVIASDSFKESMSAQSACDEIERGIKTVFKDSNCIKVPMADGGEGTIEAMVASTDGVVKNASVSGPFFDSQVKADYGLLDDGRTAVIEMAKANGIELIKKDQRNPLVTTTYGTGELIKAALDDGVEKIIIGIGGSVTNDGGAGMATALGAKFLDSEGNELSFGGGSLGKLDSIDLSQMDERLSKVHVIVASDVTNLLVGESGASKVFGPQKGATVEMVDILEKNLNHYADIVNRDLSLPYDLKKLAGGGAAGGLGAGLVAFTGAYLKRGIDIIIDHTKLEQTIKDADFVFTGEGGIDSQTKYWKTPFGVAQMAQKYNIPVISCSGYVGSDIDVLYESGFTAIFGILDKCCSLDEALRNGPNNLAKTSENIARLLRIVVQ
ncbi:MAG: glycerate kinase [Vagococcus sp.]